MNHRKNLQADLEALRERHAGGGKRYWRSLDELAETPAFQELMRAEFPEQADVWPSALSRRKFLTLMGASLALAGISGCSVRPAPLEQIVPYVHQPENIVPGRPLFFATAMTRGAGAVGLLVESHEGRPTKVEGNPQHPASDGATDIYHQAAVLALYDSDRSQTAIHLGQVGGWADADAALRKAVAEQKKTGGAGLRLLTETVVSPTLAAQIERLLEMLPKAKWCQYEPLHNDMAYHAALLAFGEPVDKVCHFDKADVVLSLDSDFLVGDPGSLRYTADFMGRRRVRTGEKDAQQATMNRLYTIETTLSSTGVKADHRLALRPQEIELFARAVAAKLGLPVETDSQPQSSFSAAHERWIATVASDLAASRGRCLVLAGERQPPAVHLLAHAMNDHLENVGATVTYIEPVEARSVDQTKQLGELVEEMKQGQVESLIVLGGNPAYTAPADFGFVEAMQKVPFRVHLGLYEDETARLCHWHLPEAHFLEAWGDARAYDGTASIVQPLIEPLYEGRSQCEMLSLLLEGEAAPGYETVRAHWREYWKQRMPAQSFEAFWQTSVHDGVIADSQYPAKGVKLKDGWQDALPSAAAEISAGGKSSGGESSDGKLAIEFQADPTVYDGRFANNGWLQELPKPVTKLTWDNAALISPRTAKQLGLQRGDWAHAGEHGGYDMPLVTLQLDGRKVVAPVWIMPGQADGAVTVHLGYGRKFAGKVGGDRDHRLGFDAYRLRTSDRPWHAAGLDIVPIGEDYPLACTQAHHLMDDREVVHAGTLEEYQHNARSIVESTADHQSQPHSAAAQQKSAAQKSAAQKSAIAPQPEGRITLYEENDPTDYSPPKHKWGMLIDMTSCIGCNACVVACQAENNIPVVGKEQVRMGREMHWIRIDRYLGGAGEEPNEFHFQPVPCMHCERAPCEYVCPVEATVHSAEGLNDMVYNRCVGTRFCSNNCPYKVRRFNFLAFADFETLPLRLQYNPDVTVRSRGVMEKCTYCVQRIRHAEIDAEVGDRAIQDGDVVTACQAACPAQAIAFGDLNDPQSTVSRWKQSPLHYGLLSELNTVPRTTYLAALRNPHPDLEANPHGE